MGNPFELNAEEKAAEQREQKKNFVRQTIENMKQTPAGVEKIGSIKNLLEAQYIQKIEGMNNLLVIQILEGGSEKSTSYLRRTNSIPNLKGIFREFRIKLFEPSEVKYNEEARLLAKANSLANVAVFLDLEDLKMITDLLGINLESIYSENIFDPDNPQPNITQRDIEREKLIEERQNTES